MTNKCNMVGIRWPIIMLFTSQFTVPINLLKVKMENNVQKIAKPQTALLVTNIIKAF